jgi:chromosomal replication initiation ATPase DnaA
MKEEILNLCADYFGCTVDDILGVSKKQTISKARKCAFYLMYLQIPKPSVVASRFNKKRWAVQYAVDDINFHLKHDTYIAPDVRALMNKLNQN